LVLRANASPGAGTGNEGTRMLGDADFVTVVSGLPRSGTSMMMRMLAAGGIEPLVDHERAPDTDNPLGYYEFQRVKTLRQDSSWVAQARGKALKVIYKLVYDLPADISYRIVFLERDLDEVLASQEAMMRRSGLDPDQIGHEVLIKLFQAEIFAFRRWAEAQANVRIFYANHARVIADPKKAAQEIAQFLGLPMDTAAMAEVVTPELHRNRG